MKYTVGMSEEIKSTITEDIVKAFAELSGDFNPIHVDETAARASQFGKRIAPGMLVGSLISAHIGMRFPGEGTIYLEQDMKFIKPVYLGDEIRIVAQIKSIRNEEKGILELSTIVYNQREEMVVDGYAIVKVPVEEK